MRQEIRQCPDWFDLPGRLLFTTMVSRKASSIHWTLRQMSHNSRRPHGVPRLLAKTMNLMLQWWSPKLNGWRLKKKKDKLSGEKQNLNGSYTIIFIFKFQLKRLVLVLFLQPQGIQRFRGIRFFRLSAPKVVQPRKLWDKFGHVWFKREPLLVWDTTGKASSLTGLHCDSSQ